MFDPTTPQIARLPSVSTNDLNGMRRTLPNGRLNVLLIAYEQWQQLEVDSWVSALERLEQLHDEVGYFELPVVGQMNLLGRRTLDFYMRRGIPDRRIRSRTLTFYADPAGFRKPLGITDAEHIAVLLVDGDGLVRWRASGARTQSAEAALRVAVDEALDQRLH